MSELVLMQQQAVANRSRKTEWQRRNRAEFAAKNGYSTAAHYGAGGSRAEVLDRDGHACVKCGMTDAEHKAKWSRPITIDHISKDRSDNLPANLQTLCLTCHGRKDIVPKVRVRKGAEHADTMRKMRADGKTYQDIADELRLSVATVWNYLQGKYS